MVDQPLWTNEFPEAVLETKVVQFTSAQASDLWRVAKHHMSIKYPEGSVLVCLCVAPVGEHARSRDA